jgi:hypothetical protein
LTPEQFITALFGEGWTPEMLPVFLETMKQLSADAQRYYIVRDNTFNIEFTNEPNSRENLVMFDNAIDNLGNLSANEDQ